MERKITTRSGDMWDDIAHRCYTGHTRGELLMHLLLEANPEYRRTVVFSSGVVLTIPEEPEDMSDTLPPWKEP
ncbi:MAG: tail protein X [Synergistaceae bacterium]|nr:tail protein X [Synergistaceae bacterium]